MKLVAPLIRFRRRSTEITLKIPSGATVIAPKSIGVASMSEHLERPPPEIGKIVVEIWCYLPEVYTLGEESEIQEIFSKKCEKSQFSLESLIKNLKIFLKSFKIFFTFCPNPQGFPGG